jgi:hypothetical protein
MFAGFGLAQNLIIAFLIFAGVFGGGYYKGHSSGKAVIQATFDKYKAEQEKKYAEAILKHQSGERAMQDAAAIEQEKHRDQVRTIDKRLSVALGELRNRSERRTSDTQMPGAAETCAGASGAELARGDAEFLSRYAADAAKLGEALHTCETRYEAVRAELDKE